MSSQATPRGASAPPPDLGLLVAALREAVVAFEGSQNRIVGWNAGAEALFGYTAAEATGLGIEALVPADPNPATCIAPCCFLRDQPPGARPDAPHQIFDALHRDDVERLQVKWQGVLQGQPTTDLQYRIIRTDGAVRTVRTASQATRDAAGLPLRIVGTLTEITDAVADRERLAASEARYRLLAENLGDVVLATDLDGLTTYASPSVAAVLGFPPAHFLGQPLAAGFSGAEASQADRPLDLYAFRHADGRPLWLEAMVRTLRDAAGAQTGTVASLRDVTARRRAEGLLALQNDILRAIAEGVARDVVLGTLAIGLAQFCGTPQALVLARGEDDQGHTAAACGLPPSYALGLDDLVANVASPPDAAWPAGRRVVDDVATSGLPTGYIDHALAHGIRAFWAQPIFDARERVVGRIAVLFARPQPLDAWHSQLLAAAAHLAGIAISRDHERAELARRTQALEAANACLVSADRQKDEFLSVISHELRGPLHVVMGNINLLQCEAGGPLAPPQLRFVDEVMRGAERMLRLVDDLLDTARVREGTLAVHPRPIAVDALVPEVVADLGPRAAAGGLALQADVPAGLVVFADEMRLGQVLENLVGNAIKFTPAGGRIDILVSAGAETVRLAVRDTGIGVPLDAHPRLFEPFQQVEAGLDRRAEGVGLGLAICKAIAEAHGGQNGVESAPGRGYSFWIDLPFVAHEETWCQAA